MKKDKTVPLGTHSPLALAEIRRSPLFAGVDTEPLWHLLCNCSIVELAPGEQLIRVGDTDGNLYVVLEGKLDIFLEQESEAAVATIGPGDSVGEISALDRKPRSAGVIVRQRARVLTITAESFWTLMSTSHTLALNLLHVLSERLRGNNATILDSRRLQEQYRRHASTDPLTGLLNRRGLEDLGVRLAQRLSREGKDLTLLMVDVDHFKRFNDEHGHQAGDYVLFAVAQLLKNGLRPTDVVTRYGGEEFTVLLPETDLNGALVAANRVRETISKTVFEPPEEAPLPQVTASMGAAQCRSGMTLDRLIAEADAALYEAKRSGRNRVVAAPALP
jgi:diguanylate cyclase (GGDEF)-like protein